MVNFTNLKSKALSLVALMALSSTVGFAQGSSEFEKATTEAGLKTAKKIFLYDGTTDKYSTFPFDSNAGIVKGVSLAVQKGAAPAIIANDGLYNANADLKDLPFNKIAPESPNDVEASYWYSDSKMNVFTRNAAATVVFDFSTKYLYNPRNLKITLGENRMGSDPTLTANWSIRTYVYEMDGTPVPTSAIYVSHANTTKYYFEELNFFTAGTEKGMADKTYKVFVNDQDNATTDLIPNALDNRLIRVVISSDVPNGEAGAHFLPALTISNCSFEFPKPSIDVTVDAWDFNSGACGTSTQKGTLTVKANNLTGAADKVLSGYKSFENNALLNTFKFAMPVNNIVSNTITFTSAYVYKPLGVETGTFNYKANVNLDGTDNLSPIKLSATHEKAIAYDSKPVVILAEDHVKFDNPDQTKQVKITGWNIPVFKAASGNMLDYKAYEKWTTDQSEKYADLEVTEVFDIADNGDIVKTTGTNPYLNLKFAQTINDISRDEAFLVSAKDWTVTTCDNVEHTGAQFGFPSLIARGNVAQLWFTYNGKSVINTPAITPDNVLFSRHDPSQPFDNARYASRVKAFMLHGTAVTATAANNIAVINVDLGTGVLNTAGKDHLEMRYSLKNPASAGFDPIKDWTNATIKTLQISLNTADQAALENFEINGIPVYVQYVPRCDGFDKGKTAEAGFEYGWNPHEFVLSAAVNDNGVSNTTTVVNLYGDTRAALTSSMNDIHSLFVMGGTQSVAPIGDIINDWYTGAQASDIVVPYFRKSYGDIYLGCESSLYWKVDSFMVAGYNLEKNVSLVQSHNTKYNNAFSTEVKMLAGSTTDGATLTPNEYGELVALVKVYFAKNEIAKVAGAVKAEDVLKVVTDENTLVLAGQEKRTDKDGHYLTVKDKAYYNFFNIGGNVNNTPNMAPEAVNGFNYAPYYEAAEVFGFIYKPTLSIEFMNPADADMTQAAGRDTVSYFWVKGTEFNPMNSRVVTIGLTEKNTPFTIGTVSGVAKINDAGSFVEQYAIKYAPVAANLCAKNNTITMTAQCANAVTSKVTGLPTWNETATNGFKLNPLDFGDIHGSMAKISWTGMPGATWYQVQVGHWKPKFTSEDVFISECKAAVGSDQILVEVFNGTGKVINKDMMVNYYLVLEQKDLKTGVVSTTKPVKGANLDNSLLNTNATKEGWHDDAVVYTFTTPINNNYEYNVKLMQGGVQMDIFSFGQAGAHLSRTAAVTRDADGMITKATTIKRNAGAFDQSAWETFHTSLPLAHYEWKNYTFFDMSDGALSRMINKQSTTINNLKPNRNYDVRVIAYNDCIVDGEETRIPISTQEINFLTMSEYTASEGDITFSDESEWPTGNEPIGVSSVNVYTKDGKIFVAGAEGSVSIYNTMGARTVQATADAAKDGISVNQGIYVVRVNNEKGITCVVK